MKAKNIEQSIWNNMNKHIDEEQQHIRAKGRSAFSLENAAVHPRDTPWRYDALNKIVRDKDGNRVAEKVPMSAALRIVEAVNSHEALTAQVKQLKNFV